MTLYRYRQINDNTKDSLRNHYLYFSPITKLNDPFEGHAEFKFSGTKAQKERFIKDVGKQYVSGSRKERRAALSKRRSVLSRDKADTDFVQTNARKILDENPVCCFSRTNNDILMWSHYAGAHTGLCLGFDREALKTLVYLRCVMEDIVYQENLPVINRVKERSAKGVYPLFRTKAKHWEYEQEVRLINTNGTSKVDFAKEWLTGIIFGCNASDGDIEEVSKLVSGGGYRTILYRTRKEKSTYGLVIEPL